MMSQPVSSSIMTVVRPTLKALRKFQRSAKTKHMREPNSRIRFVTKIYTTRKKAGTKAKKPMETLSAPSAIEGRKEAISRVALTISTTRTKNPRILFPEPANIDFFSNARPLVRHKSRKTPDS